MTMLDWNTAALNEYQRREACAENQSKKDWQGNELRPAGNYLKYQDEIFDEDDALDFIEHLGAETYEQ